MLGAILGDIAGSRFEFSNTDASDFDLFAPECCFTDDTVLTVAVAKALLECRGDYSDLYEKTEKYLRYYGRKYIDAGYGGRFFGWLLNPDMGPYNSLGNGSAMRISAVGFAAESIEEAKELAYKVTAPTHNHPEGLKGAEAAACAIFMARHGSTKEEIKAFVEKNYYRLPCTCDDYRRKNNLNHGAETCPVSLPQAFECFFESENYEDCIRKCICIGGDTDTVAAIAGGIAEAYYGVPSGIKGWIEYYLEPDLLEVVNEFYGTFF